ncbi:MAG: nucleotidyltransferase domain-containing protein [Parcubacteria group bacterium]|nr:nucleotidyltransferase domain-containing protein [Parcubacteria group bacterium]
MEISERHEQKLKEIERKYDLRLLILFGSRVSGKLHKESDYDIAYLSKRILSFEDEGRLIIDLMKVVETSDERLINLVNIREAGPLLLKEIFREHQVLFKEKGDTYHAYKIYSIKNYLDSRSLFELRDFRIKKYLTKHTASR